MAQGSKNKGLLTIPRTYHYRGIILILVILLVLGAGLIAFVFIYDSYYQHKVYPGTYFGQTYIGILEYAEARQIMDNLTNEVIDEGLTFSYNNQTFNINSVVGDEVNPELTSRLIAYDVDQTIDNLKKINYERTEADHVFYSLTDWSMLPVYELDEVKIIATLDSELAQYEQPALDAQLSISEDYIISIVPEKGGQAFNYNKIIDQVGNHLVSLSSLPITVELEPDYPAITRVNAEAAIPLVEQILEGAPYTLVYEDFAWLVSKEQARDWLVFKMINNEVSVGFDLDNEGLNNYFSQMSSDIDVEVKEAKFAMENNKVIEFQPSQRGRELQIDASLNNLGSKAKQIGIKEIDLVVNEIEPTVTTDAVNDLGIRELIGEGSSNFSGSPRNRRHNIAVGADTLNGILIEPGEDFSLVGALGEIEASTGYLPELVIKGNKTIPEYGGGLCQIGTTTFRVAIDAGFPITERRNHSYRVSYYEPAGTDAAIYNPKPDVRFINDTGNHALFTTEISGNDLIFRFYGTSDGRQVEYTNPRLYNYVKPGPTKLVETLDLAPGEKKCTERAHTGANAEFTRTITSASGEVKEEVFTSHYKPWQEVCLIGVEELSEEVDG